MIKEPMTQLPGDVAGEDSVRRGARPWCTAACLLISRTTVGPDCPINLAALGVKRL